MSISNPGDPEEREADEVAGRVMRAASGFPIGGNCSCGESGEMCQECKEKQAGIQRRAASASKPGRTPEIVGRALRSPGFPLDSRARAFFEPRFGRDFSDVRIHAGREASDSARSINALAYTHGSDIVFGDGQYSPQHPAGQHLLAHELTHVLQQSPAPSRVFRQEDPPDYDATQTDLIQKALKSGDASDVKDIDPFAFRLANDEDKIKLLNILLNNKWGVGPNDGYYIERIWASFGKNMVDVAMSHLALWDASNAHLFVDLFEIPELIPLKDQFRADIVARADSYLDSNRNKANQEIGRLGLADTGAAATAEQTQNVQKIQESAKKLKQAIDAKNRLETLLVIYTIPPFKGAGGSAPGFRCVGGYNPEQPSPAPGTDCFDPTGWLNPNGFDKYPPYEKTHDEYEKVKAVINNLTSNSPVLYALAKEPGYGDLTTVAGTKDQTEARKTMADNLKAVLSNIDKTREKLHDPKDDLPLELWPIHQQLMKAGNWAEPFHNEVAKKLVERHQQDEFWKAIGLGAFQLALFVVAELSTAGLATFFLAANAIVSGAQAVSSWQKYETLQQAGNTNLSDETSLIEQGRVADQLLDAVLATAFAFLDAYAAGKATGELLSAEEKAASAEKLAQAEKAEAKEAEIPVKQATDPELQQEAKTLQEKIQSPENVQSVIDETLAKDYDAQIQVGEHTYYHRIDGHGWCRASGVAICGYSFGPEIEEALEKIRDARRPGAGLSPGARGKISQEYVQDFLSDEYKAQRPNFFEGTDINRQTVLGMSIPDLTGQGSRRIVVEVKNIDIAENLRNGFEGLREQAGKYVSNVPESSEARFWLFLDIRGQKLPEGGFKTIVDAVNKGLGGVYDHVYFITEAGVVAY